MADETNIVEFPWVGNSPDLDPDRILEAAKGKLKRVIILGWAADDTEFTDISFADGGDALWLLEMGKERVLNYARKLREEHGL